MSRTIAIAPERLSYQLGRSLKFAVTNLTVMSSPQGGFHPLFIHLAHKYNPFESKVVMPLDDLVVHSLFAQRTPKKSHRTHTVQKLGLNFQENTEVSTVIYTAFEKKRHQLEPSKPAQYTSVIKKLALALHRGNSSIKCLSANAATVLDW